MLAMDVWCFSKSTARIDLEKHQTRLHYWGISFCNFGESPLQFWVFLLYTKHLDYNDSAIAMAGFILKNTLSDNGGVTRGVCKVAEGHTHITDVVETSNIVKTVDDGMIGAEANGVKLDPGSYVSMNFWGFPAKEGHDPAFLTVLEDGFKDFFEKDVPANPQKSEYLLPTLIGGLLRDGKCTVKVLETKDNWFGVTYKEDKAAVVESFKKLIADGVYQEELYSDL